MVTSILILNRMTWINISGFYTKASYSSRTYKLFVCYIPVKFIKHCIQVDQSKAKHPLRRARSRARAVAIDAPTMCASENPLCWCEKYGTEQFRLIWSSHNVTLGYGQHSTIDRSMRMRAIVLGHELVYNLYKRTFHSASYSVTRWSVTKERFTYHRHFWLIWEQ